MRELKMADNEKQSTESSANSPEANQENKRRPKKKRSEVQNDAVDESKLSEEQLLEFYKTKCALIQNELGEHRERCSQLEINNFELTTKIDELRQVVAKSNDIKADLEAMGIDVEKYLDLVDDDEPNVG